MYPTSGALSSVSDRNTCDNGWRSDQGSVAFCVACVECNFFAGGSADVERIGKSNSSRSGAAGGSICIRCSLTPKAPTGICLVQRPACGSAALGGGPGSWIVLGNTWRGAGDASRRRAKPELAAVGSDVSGMYCPIDCCELCAGASSRDGFP